MYFKREWKEIVCDYRDNNDSSYYPKFEVLAEFTEKRAQRANISELQATTKSTFMSNKIGLQQTRRDGKNPKALSTNIDEQDSIKTPVKCSYCSKNHFIYVCENFLSLAQENVLKFLTDNKLCFDSGNGKITLLVVVNNGACVPNVANIT